MTQPRNPIEWLLAKISYETDIHELRNHALALVLMVESDQIIDVYQEEMDQDGYFDGYPDGYDDGSDWLEDKEGWDLSIELTTGHIKNKLGRQHE